MTKPVEVFQPHAEHEESIERIVKHLGRDKIRRRIFNLIYGRGSKPRTVPQIIDELKFRSNQRQPARNQTNHLAKHKVISTVSIKPSENSGNRFAYGKIDFVMANKAEIVKKADRPELLERTPTKRRPKIAALEKMSVSVLRAVKRGRASRTKLRVLYLLANPASQEALRTDAEFRLVQDEVRGSKFRDRIDLIISPAADAKSMLRGINDYRPQIIHFSGHGGDGAIWPAPGFVDTHLS